MNQPYKKQVSATYSHWGNYAPAMGQKAPENTQSYNRYAYCLNNPMKYTDSSGYTRGQAIEMIDGVLPYYGNLGFLFKTHGGSIDNKE